MEYYQQWKSLVELNSGAITLQNNYNKSLNSNLSSLFQLDQLSDHQERLKNILSDTTLDDNTKRNSITGSKSGERYFTPKIFPHFSSRNFYHAKINFTLFSSEMKEETKEFFVWLGHLLQNKRTRAFTYRIPYWLDTVLHFDFSNFKFLYQCTCCFEIGGKTGSRFDRNSSLLFTILYSLPAFWLATLLMLLLCNPDVLNILPSSGIKPVTGYPTGSSLFEKIWLSLPYLILPTFCYV